MVIEERIRCGGGIFVSNRGGRRGGINFIE